MTILGIGNVLQKDDGLGVYATTYLQENYTYSHPVNIINGGVEGINLYTIFEANNHILILDALQLNDDPASIYLIPAPELSGHGLNAGGAHEIGVLQCLDMLELQGKPQPKATILGMIPAQVTFEIELSDTIKATFKRYIQVALNYLKKEGIQASPKAEKVTLEEIIREVRKV